MSGSLDGFADYLMIKAENAEGRTGEATYSDGMRNAAVDAGLWLAIRDRWQDQTCTGCGEAELDHGDHGECLAAGHEGQQFTYPDPVAEQSLPWMPEGDDARARARRSQTGSRPGWPGSSSGGPSGWTRR